MSHRVPLYPSLQLHFSTCPVVATSQLVAKLKKKQKISFKLKFFMKKIAYLLLVSGNGQAQIIQSVGVPRVASP